ncbi:MAG: hypothetical protein J2P57_06220 [Acidimicrobiaceae bacterium]|nr:hypothetical protein [Acidimicrobiaceae bacterium]
MGRASSNKKVARAASTGGARGRANRGRTSWTYYSVLAVVVILGVVLTVTSRNHRLHQINNAGNAQPTVGQTWNAGLGVYICGKFEPAINSQRDPYGITTKGDGIIRIHPTVKSAAGANATLGKFASSIGMRLNAAELQVPGGKLYTDGDTCHGTASHVYVKEFNNVSDTVGVLQTVNPTDVRLQDQSMYTIAFVPASDKNSLPPPPKYVIDNLNKLAASSSTTTTTPTTAPAAVQTPTTTAPNATTTTNHTTTTR